MLQGLLKQKHKNYVIITGGSHKLSDRCNLNDCLNLEGLYGNVEKVHIIIIWCNEFSNIRSK